MQFTAGESAYIINSHRSRAHAAEVRVVTPLLVLAYNLDKDAGPYGFDPYTGDAIEGTYQQVSGAVPARLAKLDDPEAAYIRARTERVQASTDSYDAVRDAAAALKAAELAEWTVTHDEAVAEAWQALQDAVDAWGDRLGL